MSRRELITLLGGAAAASPFATRTRAEGRGWGIGTRTRFRRASGRKDVIAADPLPTDHRQETALLRVRLQDLFAGTICSVLSVAYCLSFATLIFRARCRDGLATGLPSVCSRRRSERW